MAFSCNKKAFFSQHQSLAVQGRGQGVTKGTEEEEHLRMGRGRAPWGGKTGAQWVGGARGCLSIWPWHQVGEGLFASPGWKFEAPGVGVGEEKACMEEQTTPL